MAVFKPHTWFGKAEGWAFGDQKQPGVFGTGVRTPNQAQVNTGAAANPRYNFWQRTLGQGATQSANRAAPMMQAAQLGAANQFGGATIDASQQAQFRNQQTALAQMLMQGAMGQGPSAAQGQLAQATDRNMAQALGMASAINPNGGGAALRNLAAQRGAMSQQAASDASILRAQEQMAAQNMLGQVLAGARGQDIGLATEQAGLSQQAGLFNADARNQFALQQAGFQQQAGMANQQSQLQQQAMNDAMVSFYTSQGMSLDEAQRQAAMEMERLRMETALGNEQLAQGAYDAAANRRSEQTTGLLNAVGDAFTFAASKGSDERIKRNVRPAHKKLDAWLDALGVHEYSYKDEKYGKGPHISPMAQEMERSELGRAFVFEDEGTKMVDYGKMAATLLAGEARLHQRLKILEETVSDARPKIESGLARLLKSESTDR